MKNNKKSSIWFYLINFIIILLVSILTICKIIDQNGKDSLINLKNLTPIAVIALIGFFLINYYLEGIIISLCVKKEKQYLSASQGFIIQSVGGLFSAITPLKSGYVPGVAYAYSKFNVKGDTIIKSVAKTTFSYQIVSLLISAISLVICLSTPFIIEINGTELDLKIVALVGLIYNIALLIGYFILVLFPPIHNVILKLLSSILFKIKKIDNKESYLEEKMHKMDLIRQQIRDFFKDFKQFIVIFLLYLLKTIFFSSLPYFIYMLITKYSFNIETWLYTIMLSNLISYVTNVVPIPGASGAAEIVFVAVFSLLFNSSVLTGVMLVWRMFSYFINIIVGFIVFVIILNINRKKQAIE